MCTSFQRTVYVCSPAQRAIHMSTLAPNTVHMCTLFQRPVHMCTSFQTIVHVHTPAWKVFQRVGLCCGSVFCVLEFEVFQRRCLCHCGCDFMF
jgi:hypothetical protein